MVPNQACALNKIALVGRNGKYLSHSKFSVIQVPFTIPKVFITYLIVWYLFDFADIDQNIGLYSRIL